MKQAKVHVSCVAYKEKNRLQSRLHIYYAASPSASLMVLGGAGTPDFPNNT